MKVTSLIAIASAAKAMSFGSGIDYLKQQFLSSDDVAIGSPEDDISLLAQLREIWGDLKESYLPEVVESWKYMEENFDASTIKKAMRLYALKNKLTKSQQRNAFRNSFVQPEFETVSLSRFEDHTLRVKKNHPELLGLDTVDQYTGYLDVEKLDKHSFYWLFESRNDPENDPLILWLNGGPGCSSLTGLFFELGPSSINATLQPVFNPYSWNANATVIFLDQPVGVGYSYSGAEEISSSRAAAKDVFIFLELFFQKFPKFLGSKFHIAGESYAGHYIPAIATEILDHADRSFELSSILIGNGITDPLIQEGSYKPMGCGEGGYKPVLSEEECDKMESDYAKCVLAEKVCYATEVPFTCVPANVICGKLSEPYEKTGLNFYDIRKKCEGDNGLCYKELEYVDDYMNSEFVKNAVGANVDIFTSCDDTVFFNFFKSGDGAKPFHRDVADILEKGVPVLLYAGDKDYICNWVGNHQWSDALEYSGHEQFSAAPLRQYSTKDGKLAGEAKNFEHFTFLRIYDAGHMVPYDQPEVALDMVNRWVAGDYAFSDF